MADSKTEDPAAAGATSTGYRYFRSSVAGLRIIIGKPENGEVEVPRVQFRPFQERNEEGEAIKVGYLRTRKKAALERLIGDPNVTEIDQDEYEKRTDLSNDKVRPLPE